MTEHLATLPLRSRRRILFVTDAPDGASLASAVDGLADALVSRPGDTPALLARRDVDVIVFDRVGAAEAELLLAEASALRPGAVQIVLGDARPDADPETIVLPSPVDARALRAVCTMALRTAAVACDARTLAHENRRFRGPDVEPDALGFEDLGRIERYEGVYTRSPAMARTLAFLQRVEGSEAPLVIEGEPGAGKRCVAEAIHRRSRRRGRPFAVAMLGDVSDRGRESLLFGHRAGAGPDGPGTCAASGRLVEAEGGTVYVDDIADASPALQLALLRVVEDGTFTPLGAERPRRADVRILAGTRRNLDDMVRQGLFRRDLFERLRIATIEVPPLRERPEDVFLLARVFLVRASATLGRKAPGISREARAVLESYHWPGNVHELANVMERASILCKGGLVIAADLPLGWNRATAPGDVPTGAMAITIPPSGASLKQLEREIFVKTLALAGGNQSRAAHILGLCESTFRFRLHKLGIASRRTAPAAAPQLAANTQTAGRA